MADSNRVSVPKELIPRLRAEAETLLLTDDLTSAVAWILRKYFKDQANPSTPTTSASPKIESITDYDDLFVA
jgi:hypothetical protein